MTKPFRYDLRGQWHQEYGDKPIPENIAKLLTYIEGIVEWAYDKGYQAGRAAMEAEYKAAADA